MAPIIVQELWVIQYSMSYGPICEWGSILTKLVQLSLSTLSSFFKSCIVIYIHQITIVFFKYTVIYGPICEWASNLHKFRVHLC